MIRTQLLLPLLFVIALPVFAQPIKPPKLAHVYAIKQVAWPNTAQNYNFSDERISTTMRGALLKEILAEITRHKKIYFSYDSDIENFPRRRNLKYKNELVSRVLINLKKLFPIEYIHKGRVIIVKFLPGIIKSVTCLVVDTNNNPIANAAITVQQYEETYLTDRKGQAKIPYLLFGEMLLVGSEKYVTVKEIVNGNLLKVKLTENARTMTSVTVYNNGVEKIPDIIATGLLKASDVNKCGNVNPSPNIIDRLEYLLPINKIDNPMNGSLPGPVRGTNSFYGNRTGFLVVNNFPFNLPTDLVNPNDIDSVTILRDAGAGAIWGTSSANGVWSLSYQKGRSDKRVINFLSSLTVGEKPDIFYQQGMDAASRIKFDSMGYKYPGAYTPVRWLLNQLDNNGTNKEAVNKLFEEWKKNDLLKDIKNFLYDYPITQQYAINIQTGGPKFLFYASGGLDEKKLAQKGNTWGRKTILVNSSFKENDFQIEGAVAITGITNKNNAITVPFSPRYLALKESDGRPASIPYLYPPEFVQQARQNGFLDWHYKPLEEVEFMENKTNQNYYSFSGNASYSFLNNFKASVAYQHSIYIKNDEQLHKLESFYSRNLINLFRQKDSTGKIFWPILQGDILDGNDLTVRINNLRTQLDYSLARNDYKISALAGIDRRSFDLKGKEYRIYGKNLSPTSVRMNYEKDYTLSTGGTLKIPFPERPYDSSDHFFSIYSSAFLTYKDRYTLSGNVRRDWSNRFSRGLKKKGVGLWSGGIGWNVDKEEFFNSNSINKLKLRVSYGLNGNIDYTTLPTHSIQSVNNGQVYTYAIPSTQQIGWEKTATFNLGIDFKNKIFTTSIDYYLKRGKDLLQFSARNPVTGTSVIKDNSGSLKGNGLDIDFQTKTINISKKISYTSGFIFIHSKNVTTSYGSIKKPAYETINPYSYAPITGYPTDALFAYKFAGLSPTTGAPRGYLNGEKSEDYINIMSATDGSTIEYVGSSIPTAAINWANSWYIGRWSLSVMVSGKFGYWVRKPAINYHKLLFGVGGDAPGFDKRWQKPGDEKITNIPAFESSIDNIAMAFYEGSTANVVKGDHIRLQYVQVAYQYEKDTNSKSLFNRFECFLTASNLGFVSRANSMKLDPDLPLNVYPAGRSLTLTLKISY